MKATLENLDKLYNFIIEQHESNNERGEFDDEMDLKDVLNSAQEHLKEADEKPNYILRENGIQIIGSHMVVLSDEIQQEELHEYSITHRESLIEELYRWIGEGSRDAELMKQDLRELETWKDDYILSSNSTNSYIGQDSSEFDETCKELIEINEGL